jgi:hypothetical protein
VYDRITDLRARADRPIEVQLMSVPADPKVFDMLQQGPAVLDGVWLRDTRVAPGEPACLELIR